MSLKEQNKIIKEKPKKQPIYIMTLELEKGNPEKIEIYPDSNPDYLATYFCKKHNLDYNGLFYLKQKISNLLKQNEKNNKENMNNNNNIHTISKNQCSKSKQKISRNFDEIHYKDNKTENINNNRIKKKIHQIENIHKNNNNKIKEDINNNINKLKKYQSLKKPQIKKIENEEEKVQELFPIKTENNKKRKNKSNDKYQKILISKSYKDISKENNICSRISKDYEKKFSFHPNINENYKTDLTFEERQKFFKNLYIKRKNELNKFYSNQKKDENGHLFFRPNLITKNYKIIKNNFEEDIFQKNYQIYKKYDLNREELTKKYYKNYPENNKNNKMKNINNKIFSKNKIRAFNNLFNALDSDGDGIISGINININSIPKNIINIIQPLLIELKEENQTLNKNEFIIAMNKLFEDISLIQKREIINKYKTIYRNNKSFDLSNSYKINFFVNNNTDKLANNHYNKIVQFLTNKNCQKNKIKINLNKSNNIDINNNISKYTFNNYIKNLN